MRTHCKRPAPRGFTLIEILIVVVILGILAAIVIPQFTSAADDAHCSAAQSHLQTLRSQTQMYHFDNSEYPTGLGVLVTDDYMPELPCSEGDGATDTCSLGGDFQITYTAADGTLERNWDEDCEIVTP